MAANTNVQVIISAKDNASKVLKGVGNEFDSLGKKVKRNINAGAIAATGFIGAMGALGKSMVQVGAQFEQNRIAFETMLGSADLAKESLKELSEFARKTPFDLPEVLKGAKGLLAMGTAAEDLIPEMRMLGDVSAGLGVPMERLILNFGQVRTQGKLTGRELRDFSVAGVPLMDALVQVLNKQGGAMTLVGATSTKTREKMDKLGLSIQKQTNRFEEMKSKGVDEASASFRNLGLSMDANKKKLAALGPVTEGFQKRIKITKEEIAKMVSDGELGFDEVSQAFKLMTGEGGKFFNLMDKQSKSLSGVVSNLRDTWIRFAASVVGVEETGEIREGSIFFFLKIGAEKLLEVLEKIQEPATQFIDKILQNKDAVLAFAGALGGLLVLIGIAFVVAFGPAIATAIAFAAAGALLVIAVKKISEKFRELRDTFINEWIPALQRTKEGIIDFTENTIAFFRELPGKVMEFVFKLFIEDIPFAVGFMIGWLRVKIPEIIGNMITWFSELPGKIGAIFEETKNVVIEKLTAAWDWIRTNVPTWPGKIKGFIEDIPGEVATIFDELISVIIDKLLGGTDSAWGKILEFKDNVVGAFDSIRDAVSSATSAIKRGFEAGVSAATGDNFVGPLRKAGGGVVPGAIGEPVPILAHGGETVLPAGIGQSQGQSEGGGISFNVSIGLYAGTETEKREIAKELYLALVQSGIAENKTVAELLGG